MPQPIVSFHLHECHPIHRCRKYVLLQFQCFSIVHCSFHSQEFKQIENIHDKHTHTRKNHTIGVYKCDTRFQHPIYLSPTHFDYLSYQINLNIIDVEVTLNILCAPNFWSDEQFLSLEIAHFRFIFIYTFQTLAIGCVSSSILASPFLPLTQLYLIATPAAVNICPLFVHTLLFASPFCSHHSNHTCVLLQIIINSTSD